MEEGGCTCILTVCGCMCEGGREGGERDGGAEGGQRVSAVCVCMGVYVCVSLGVEGWVCLRGRVCVLFKLYLC